jgi:galactonate dehydratase
LAPTATTISGIRTHVVGAGWRNFVFVEIETAAGVVGLGEASLEGQTHGVVGAIKDLESLFVGADPARIEHLWQQAYRHAFWRGGPAFLSALSGLETALWDIKGQMLGVPIYRLLGGRVRDRIRMYANGPRGDDPETMATHAAELVSRGFSAIKCAPFPATPLMGGYHYIMQGVRMVAAVREAVGPEVDIMVDAHGRLGPAAAMQAAQALEEYRIFFLEESVLPENVDQMVRAAAKTSIPIATGERIFTKFGFRELFEKRACAIVQPDLGHCGGISELRKIGAFAEMYFISIAPHNPLSWVNTIASMHVDLTMPNFLIQELIADPQPWMDEIVSWRPEMAADGTMDLPDTPGLGVTLNHDAIKRYPPGDHRMPALWHVDGSVADW